MQKQTGSCTFELTLIQYSEESILLREGLLPLQVGVTVLITEINGYNTTVICIEGCIKHGLGRLCTDECRKPNAVIKKLYIVSEQFLNGTSAQYRLCSAILLKLYKS